MPPLRMSRLLHRDFKVDNLNLLQELNGTRPPSHLDLLAYHQRKDIFLLAIRRDNNKVRTPQATRATWVLECRRGALSRAWHRSHRRAGRVCRQDFQSLLNVDLLKPYAAGFLDSRSPGGF